MMNKQIMLLFFLMPGVFFAAAPDTKHSELAQRTQKKHVTITGDVRPTFNNPTRTLLIFLDEQESEFGTLSFDSGKLDAISLKLFQALYQKAAPILVSRNLLINVLGWQTLSLKAKKDAEWDAFTKLHGKALRPSPHQKLKKYYDAVTKVLNEYPKKSEEQIRKELPSISDYYEDAEPGASTFAHVNPDVFRTLILELLDFNPLEWIMRQTADRNMYLLVPRTYIPSFSKYTPRVLSQKDKLTSMELHLGLKIEHMLEPAEEDLKDIREKQRHGSEANADAYFINNLEQIFVTRTDYRHYVLPFNKMPAWVIYMAGHGLMNKVIAFLSLDNFTHFLHFLETNILTKLFAYSSCYAVGTNIRVIFGELRSAASGRYSFAIATEGVADKTVGGGSIDISLKNIDFERKKLRISTPLNFKKFVTETQADVINYDEALGAIFQTKKDAAETPHLRLPGLEWFAVRDVNKHVISLGSVKAIAGTAPLWRAEPLRLSTYLQARQIPEDQLQAIFLYTHEIPYPIIIDIKHMPKFISMIPGNASHSFIQLSAPFDLQTITHAFSTNSHKVFLFDRLECAPLKLIEGSMRVLTNVVIDVEEKIMERDDFPGFRELFPFFTYFTVHNHFYKKPPLQAPVRIKENYYGEYVAKSQSDAFWFYPQELKEVLKGKKSRSMGTIANYRTLEQLRQDPDFNAWKAKFAGLKADDITAELTKMRTALQKKQEQLAAAQKKLSVADIRELAMIRKYSEFLKLTTEFKDSSTEDKKTLEKELLRYDWHKNFERLKADAEFMRWKSLNYDQKGPEELKVYSAKTRDQLVAKKRKYGLTPTEEQDLAMLGKMQEFEDLESWYATLSALDKKKLAKALEDEKHEKPSLPDKKKKMKMKQIQKSDNIEKEKMVRKSEKMSQ